MNGILSELKERRADMGLVVGGDYNVKTDSREVLENGEKGIDKRLKNKVSKKGRIC